MNWEIFTYGSGDQLRMTLTAIASLFGNDDYAMAMMTTATIAFVGYLVIAAFDRQSLSNFRWLIGMIVLYMATVVPKVDVIVNDRVMPANSAVVGNVPIGLAMTAGFFSQIGDYFARSFETVFSMPNAVRYTENGLLFAHSMLDDAAQMRITDARTKANMNRFIKNCVVIDGLGMRRFTVRELDSSANLAEFFSTRVAANAASFMYINSGGDSVIRPCRDGFANSLRPDIEAIADAMIEGQASESFWNIGKTGDTAGSVVQFQTKMQGALQFLTGLGQSPQRTAMQFAQVNALGDGWVAMSKDLDFDAGLQAIVIEKAERERELSYHAMTQLSGEMLPMLQAIFECFIYAIFPIVVLLAIVSPAKASLGYVKALIWINLWPAMYAVIHFMVSYYDQNVMSAIVGSHGGGFSAYANTALLEKMVSSRNTVGYLAASIPIISWMLIAQSGAMMAAFAGRVLQGYDSSVGHAATEAASGQMRMGGLEYKTVPGGFAANSNEMAYTTADGIQVRDHGGGGQTVANPQSSTQITTQTIDQMVSRAAQGVSRAEEHMAASSAALQQTVAASISEMNAAMTQISQQTAASDSLSTSQRESVENAVSMREALKEQLSAGAGVSQQGIESLFGDVRGSVGFELFGTGNGFKASGGVKGEKSEMSSEDWKKVNEWMRSEENAQLFKSAIDAARQASIQTGTSETASGSDQLQAVSQRLDSALSEYRESYSERTAAMESFENSRSLAFDYRVDGIDAFLGVVAQAEGVSKLEAASMVNDAARSGDTTSLDRLFSIYESGRSMDDASGGRMEDIRGEVQIARERMENVAGQQRAQVESSGIRSEETVRARREADETRSVDAQKVFVDAREEQSAGREDMPGLAKKTLEEGELGQTMIKVMEINQARSIDLVDEVNAQREQLDKATVVQGMDWVADKAKAFVEE